MNVLITGASSGIGLALARDYAARGHRLILIGLRAREDLEGELFGVDTYCQVDFREPGASARVAAFCATLQVDRLDRLIHNAGVAYVGENDESPETIEALLAVNLRAPMHLTHALLPRLQAARGRIVFVSSVVSKMPSPRYPVYAASKAALEAFARALRIELRGQVGVTVVRPGATRTEMHARAGMSLSAAQFKRFASVERSARGIRRATESGARMRTLGLGNRCVSGLFGKTRIFDAWIPASAARLAPSGGVGRPRAMVTGAADGIGRAFALRFAFAGYDLVNVDVDAQMGARTASDVRHLGAGAEVLTQDLITARGRARAAEALGACGGIDLAIHNAGISATGPFARLDPSHIDRLIGLNLQAPMQLHGAMLRGGTLRPGSTTVFIASLSVFVGYPGAAVYAASKAGLAAYARSQSVALRGQAKVLSVFPGPTRTVHAARHSPDNSRAERRMSPEDLAVRVHRAVDRAVAVLIPGRAARLSACLGGCAPRLMDRAMERALFRPILDRFDDPA